MNVNEIIDYIKSMNEKDRLKLAIRLSETAYSNVDYDKKEKFEKFDTKLKEIDENYRIYQSSPKHILMIVSRITELKKEEQNQIELYLFNITQSENMFVINLTFNKIFGTIYRDAWIAF